MRPPLPRLFGPAPRAARGFYHCYRCGGISSALYEVLRRQLRDERVETSRQRQRRLEDESHLRAWGQA
jgi:hypothetical protein